jgi:hypothetical protein
MLFRNSVLYISPKRKYSYHLLVKYNKKTQKMYVFFIHAFILIMVDGKFMDVSIYTSITLKLLSIVCYLTPKVNARIFTTGKA